MGDKKLGGVAVANFTDLGQLQLGDFIDFLPNYSYR